VNWKIATGNNDPFLPLTPEEMGLFDALMHPEYDNLGLIINEMRHAVEGVTGINESLKTRHIYSLTLLGDPSLIPCLGIPQEMEVQYNYFIDQSLFFDLSAEPAALFALSDSEGNLIYADKTDDNGSGFVILEDFNDNFLKLVITAKNRVPYFADINITYNDSNSISSATAQCGNYPNPFNQSTTIYRKLGQNNRFEDEKTHYQIFNLKCQKVEEFWLSDIQPEFHWNARNEQGKPLPSGIYLIKADNHESVSAAKLILIK
jgi:Secretion system C-terminal sorting domain